MRRVPTPHHTAAQGHYQIVLIRWLQLTEVRLYLIYLRISFLFQTFQSNAAVQLGKSEASGVCLEGVLRKRDGSEVTDEETKEKTTTLYSFFLGRVVSARNEYQKKVHKIEKKEFAPYLSYTCNPYQQQYNH